MKRDHKFEQVRAAAIAQQERASALGNNWLASLVVIGLLQFASNFVEFARQIGAGQVAMLMSFKFRSFGLLVSAAGSTRLECAKIQFIREDDAANANAANLRAIKTNDRLGPESWLPIGLEPLFKAFAC